jgi:flagellar hook protein FlgE
MSTAVTGLQAHTKMLDVSGNNLANVNTTGYKASTITFAELLSQTLRPASAPTSTSGGRNPQQMGTGVAVAGITPDVGQGIIVDTGNPLDVAIEGAGYFVVNDGERDLYTRAGTFGIDQDGRMVDPSTGHLVQRIGPTGEDEGFQIPGDNSIRVLYDVALPARATSELTLAGNLSADAPGTARAQEIRSSIDYTVGGSDASETTEIDQLDQFDGGSGPGGELVPGETGTITLAGYNKDGTAFSTGLTFAVADTTTLGDLVTHLNTNVLTGATASLVNGKIQIADDDTGVSRLDMTMSYGGTGTLTTPPYFQVFTVGGDEVKNVNIAVYDSQGGKHVVSAALVRTDTVNTWDMILTAVTGRVSEINPDNRRISGISFSAETGAYAGIPTTENGAFTITFEHDTTNPQTIAMNFGTVGSFDGLTQFAGNSTAVARDQDGYGAGNLSEVSVSDEGVLIGAFSNGIKKDLATLQLALFKNPAALKSAGASYFTTSANSGSALSATAGSAGAGTIHGAALEKSNADVASEFVNLIRAQNGFQANARTIKVANDILREMTNLIR